MFGTSIILPVVSIYLNNLSLVNLSHIFYSDSWRFCFRNLNVSVNLALYNHSFRNIMMTSVFGAQTLFWGFVGFWDGLLFSYPDFSVEPCLFPYYFFLSVFSCLFFGVFLLPV